MEIYTAGIVFIYYLSNEINTTCDIERYLTEKNIFLTEKIRFYVVDRNATFKNYCVATRLE